MTNLYIYISFIKANLRKKGILFVFQRKRWTSIVAIYLNLHCTQFTDQCVDAMTKWWWNIICFRGDCYFSCPNIAYSRLHYYRTRFPFDYRSAEVWVSSLLNRFGNNLQQLPYTLIEFNEEDQQKKYLTTEMDRCKRDTYCEKQL